MPDELLQCDLPVRVVDDPMQMTVDGERHDVLLNLPGWEIKVDATALDDRR